MGLLPVRSRRKLQVGVAGTILFLLLALVSLAIVKRLTLCTCSIRSLDGVQVEARRAAPSADEPSEVGGSKDGSSALPAAASPLRGGATSGNEGMQVGGRTAADLLPQRGSAPMVIHAANHRGPSQLCSYTEGELQAILTLPHSCGFKEKRYFHEGSWMTWRTLREHFNNSLASEAREGQEGGERGEDGGKKDARKMECVLACKYHKDLRCSPSQPCVHAFHLRANSTDVLVLRQLYEWGERFLKPHFAFSSVLDAGANIGVMAVLLATMYPSARIVAVEASSLNFRVLQRNVAPYPNVVALNAAVWPRTAPLSLILHPHHRRNHKANDWAFMVQETAQLSPGEAVEDELIGVSVPFLLRAFGLPAFDFVKIDIEGGEGELFDDDGRNDLTWVDGAQLLALKLHGWMVPGSNDTVINYFAHKSTFVRKDVECEYDVFVRKGSDIRIE